MHIKPMLRVPLLLTVVFLIGLVAVLGGVVRPAVGSDTAIDQYILNEIATKGKANLFVKMAGDADLNAAYGITNRVDRLNYVHDTLTAYAAASQAEAIRFLQGRGASYESFWINNSIYVRNADLDLARTLAQLDGVAYLRGDREIPLDKPLDLVISDVAPTAIEWGVSRINADDVWNTGNTGVGIVVASVDTGVRWTHDAIDDQYRGVAGNHNYNWWDPDKVYAQPTDGNGHGTHTMGTMVGNDGGSNRIGVAPGAKWIAAQGCDTNSCSNFDLTSSAQWIACPTDLSGLNPDCSKAPDVVNNSWGGGGGDSWYQSYVNAWQAAGIAPIFSAGTSGPGCNTLGSPGDYTNVLGVGATNSTNKLSSFSSKGPGAFGGYKPNVVAPGESVRSAWNTSDTAYSTISGTSMAAPHVSGAVALLLADTPSASLSAIANALQQTTVKGLPAPTSPTKCGGIRYSTYPNYIYGYGLVNVCDAVDHSGLPGGAACP